MTEEAYFSSLSRKECFEDLDVEEYEIVATLDEITSELCRSLDGQVFKLKDYQSGVTAPPFHPWCRTTTAPYFGDDFGKIGERAARDKETGKTFYIPDDIKYPEWENTFVKGGDKSNFDVIDVKNTTHYSYKKSVDNSAESDIIEVGSEEMYRKSNDKKIEPMPKKQFRKIEKSFKAKGGIIQYDDATDEYLKSKNAEAITYNEHTILIRKNAGRASVFEELIHTAQYRNGENDGTYMSRLKCEIAAQEKLIKCAAAYKLTEVEVDQTRKALSAYKHELKEYIKNGGA